MDTEIDIKVSRAGFNTILAALRFWQERGMAHGANRSDLIQGIVCDEDDDTGLGEAGIDEFCERINCGQGLGGHGLGGHGLTPEARDEPAGTPGLLAEDPRTQLLVSVFWDNEVSGQYAMLLGEGQTAQEIEEAFYEQWSRCIRALREEDPDDEWGTDEAVERMRQHGWRMESFEDKLEVDLAPGW